MSLTAQRVHSHTGLSHWLAARLSCAPPPRTPKTKPSFHTIRVKVLLLLKIRTVNLVEIKILQKGLKTYPTNLKNLYKVK
jgi:hypothetical protein